MSTDAFSGTSSTGSTPVADLAVIGGSGFYSWLDGAREYPVATPFGPPSDPPVVGEVAGRRVAFLPRHGRDHRLAPHRINYRANLWALRSLGVRQVLAPCAVGSLRVEIPPGRLVVPDQLIDRTWGRRHTVFDDDGPIVHVSLADPYCPRGRAAVSSAAVAANWPTVEPATMVVVNGPRFSSRAESLWHSAIGGHIVGMTGAPEAALARELAVCYTAVAVVTDSDAGVDAGTGVSHTEVMVEFARNVTRLKAMLTDVVATLPTDDDCACRHALDGHDLPFALP